MATPYGTVSELAIISISATVKFQATSSCGVRLNDLDQTVADGCLSTAHRAVPQRFAGFLDLFLAECAADALGPAIGNVSLLPV